MAYSYIGPDLTWAIYRNGTIGRAKEDLEATAHRLAAKLAAGGGRAFVSVNKALVTQASSAIPVVPLYISLLYKVMKANGLHEGCIEQIQRLFADRLAPGADPQLDDEGRIRIDDWEMRPEIQAEVAALWPQVDHRESRSALRHRRLPHRIPEALRLRPARRGLRSRDRSDRAAALGVGRRPMSRDFAELDFRSTPLGDLSLRRRRVRRAR